MIELLLNVHSVLRWLIVLAAIAGIAFYGLAWMRGRSAVGPGGTGTGLMAGFSSLIDAQVLLGVILLAWDGFTGTGFPSYRIAHGMIMLIAAALVHTSARWRRANTQLSARNNVLVILGTLLLIFIGVAILPQGWFS